MQGIWVFHVENTNSDQLPYTGRLVICFPPVIRHLRNNGKLMDDVSFEKSVPLFLLHACARGCKGVQNAPDAPPQEGRDCKDCSLPRWPYVAWFFFDSS